MHIPHMYPDMLWLVVISPTHYLYKEVVVESWGCWEAVTSPTYRPDYTCPCHVGGIFEVYDATQGVQVPIYQMLMPQSSHIDSTLRPNVYHTGVLGPSGL